MTAPTKRIARKHTEPKGPLRAVPNTPNGPAFNLTAAIKQMPLIYLQCRDYHHSWRPYASRWSQQDGAYESTLRCDRCTTLRTRLVDSNGYVVRSSYDYADDYLMPPGNGGMSKEDRAAMRLASVLAVLPDDTARHA